MKDKHDQHGAAPASYGRRSFLFAAAGGSAAGVAAVSGLGKSAEATPEALAEPNAEATGYRETAHVQRYYRSTRL